MTWPNSIVPSPKVVKNLNFELNLYVMWLKICSYWLFWFIADMSRQENFTFSKKNCPHCNILLKILILVNCRHFQTENFTFKKKKNRLIQDLGQNSRQNFQKFFVSLLTHPLRDENSVWTCPQCPDRMGLKISLFSKNFCLIQDFAQNCLFGLLLTWSRLKISLFLKISTLPKILLKIVIMWTCPDWKFHSFQRLLPNRKILQNIASLVQDFAQNHHFGSPLKLFPNTFHSIPDFDQNHCHFSPLRTCPERKISLFQKKIIFCKNFHSIQDFN